MRAAYSARRLETPTACRRHASAMADLGTAGGALELRVDGGGADAALAQAALLGGLDVIAGRIDPTLELIVAQLARRGLVDRYVGQPDPLLGPRRPLRVSDLLAGRGARREGARRLAMARVGARHPGPLRALLPVLQAHDRSTPRYPPSRPRSLPMGLRPD